MIKYIYLIVLLLPCTFLSSQSKGINPFSNNSKELGETYAIIIGVSDYQDDNIPDLKYAHKDAIAFKEYLKSNAGGALKNENIRLLINEDATIGNIINCFDWLISVCKEEDQAFIYFSGHGDVERLTKFQRGYWLPWDSPPAVYAAGAFSFNFLKDIVATLTDSDVSVILIADACRAGKLAGENINGSQASNAVLSQQFTNEIKILSCQPNEYSVEGMQWGNGRGCFSFHLIEGLYGLADIDLDGKITLKEIARYLEDKVSKEVSPNEQNPYIIGNKTKNIAIVNDSILTQIINQKSLQDLVFEKIDTRDNVFSTKDSTFQRLYQKFKNELEKNNLIKNEDSNQASAFEYFTEITENNSLAIYHAPVTREYCAALINEGQQFLNMLLKTESEAIEALRKAEKIDYNSVYKKIKLAAELLGEDHYMYNNLKAREQYFLEKTYHYKTLYGEIWQDSIKNERKNILWKGLEYDDEASYILADLLSFYLKDSFEIIAKRLENLSPNWAYGQYQLGKRYKANAKNDIAIQHFKKSIAADPKFLPSYYSLYILYSLVHDEEKAKIILNEFVDLAIRKIYLEKSPKYVFELTNLAHGLFGLGYYNEAEKIFKEVETINNGEDWSISLALTELLLINKKYMEAILSNEKSYKLRGTIEKKFNIEGRIYEYFLNDFENAVKAYKSAIQNGDNSANVWMGLYNFKKGAIENSKTNFTNAAKGKMFFTQFIYFMQGETNSILGKKSTAKKAYERALLLSPPTIKPRDRSNSNLIYHLLALSRLKRFKELNKILQEAKHELKDDAWFHYNLACFYAMTDNNEKAIIELNMAIELGWSPNSNLSIFGTFNEPLLIGLQNEPSFNSLKKEFHLKSNIDLEKQSFYRDLIDNY